tara:strand:- start:566 stop:946 length:381 start_codon:yes stop_codon:yes gene_type:complete
MASTFVPDVDGIIIIPEMTFDIYHTLFKTFNVLSTREAEQYREQNRKDIKHFFIVKGIEMETLINKLVIPSLVDSKLLSNQLNKMREMMGKKVLSMSDILKFLEAQYILKYTQKGKDIKDKVAKEV